MTENDVKKELRSAHGTACYVCAQLKPRMSDVVLMMFRPDKVAAMTPENTYLCCKSCATKIRNRPISAYATEQLARIESERVRLGQLSRWHNIYRMGSQFAPDDGIIQTFKGAHGGTYVRGLDAEGNSVDIEVVPPLEE